MICPSCGGKFKVIDTRSDQEIVYRRRECKDCGERYTTYEFRPGQLIDLFEENLSQDAKAETTNVINYQMPDDTTWLSR